MYQLPEPITYATNELNRRPPLVTLIAITSLCIASLSLLINGILENNSLDNLQAVKLAPVVAARAAVRWAARPPAPLPPVVRWPPSAHHWRALTPVEITAAITSIESQLAAPLGGQSVTEKQKETLRKILSAPNQPMIDPNLSLNFQSRTQIQILRAMPGSDHSMSIGVRHGSALDIYRTRIDAEGHQTVFPTFGSTTMPFFAPARGRAFTPLPLLPASPPPNYHAQYISALISCILIAVQIALALLLLVAAIGLLMSKNKAIRLHWLFVIAKFIIIPLSATRVLPGWAGSAEPLYGLLGTPLVCAGLIYPSALIFILRGRTFRLYPAGGSAVIGFGFGDPRPQGFVALGTVSLWVAIFSLLVSGVYFAFFYSSISERKIERAAEQRSAAFAAVQTASLARAAANRPPPRTLTTDEIAQFISLLQMQLQRSRPPMSLNLAQANDLKKLLSTPGQQIIDPNISFGIPRGVDALMQRIGEATITQTGSLHLTLLRGNLSTLTSCVVDIDSAGRELQPPAIYLPTPPSPNVASSPQTASNYDNQERAAIFATGAFVFDLIPPIVLGIGAWLLLKGKSRGIQFHRIYVWMKIITALFTIIAYFGVASANDADEMAEIANIIAAIFSIPIIGLAIYPFVLLFVLPNLKPIARSSDI